MPRNFQIGECDAEGCERAKKVHGYCDTHYRRWRKFGDPRADDPILLSKDRTGPLHPRYKGRITRRDGYVQVWRPGHPLARADGYVQEHRLVLYEAGIDVPRGAHVHHLNHVKDDNRVENLRVMTASEHMGTTPKRARRSSTSSASSASSQMRSASGCSRSG